ncbi:MAG: carboxylating nicotinate-nucleotide diphosphorylase [Acidobacteriota bacterium]
MEALEPAAYRDVVRRALAEDLGWGDATTSAVVAGEARAAGVLSLRRAGVVAGLDAAIEAFRQLDPALTVEVYQPDGSVCAARARIARIQGLASSQLTAERTALNLLGHLCGIATLTRRMVDAAGGRLQIVDTRKTLPSLRALEKYAVRVGGGINGRFALDDGIVIKANHLRLAGSVSAAVALARGNRPDVPVQVEVASLEEVDEALAAGAAVLLIREPAAADLRAAKQRCEGRARIEVSGRYGPDELDALVAAGADLVSVACLIDSAPAVDVTLELDRA